MSIRKVEIKVCAYDKSAEVPILCEGIGVYQHDVAEPLHGAKIEDLSSKVAREDHVERIFHSLIIDDVDADQMDSVGFDKAKKTLSSFLDIWHDKDILLFNSIC